LRRRQVRRRRLLELLVVRPVVPVRRSEISPPSKAISCDYCSLCLGRHLDVSFTKSLCL
jgi:hypothetical protein